MRPYVIAVIFARGGSKGVPGKNIKLLAGKPLIAYAIETALNSTMVDRVAVSTDDPVIANIATEYGAEVPFIRPPELARDDSPELLAWQHAITMLKQDFSAHAPSIFLCVPPTSPMRSVEDINNCIEALVNDNADMVITVKIASHNPYYNMIVLDSDGYARLVVDPVSKIFRRQDAPTVYEMTTVAYAAKPDYVLHTDFLLQGRVRAVVVPPERAVDIDTELDFKFAEFLLENKENKQG